VFGPALSADGLTLFFSTIEGDEDILAATRVGLGAAFSSATRVANIDTEASEDGTPFLSADGLSLYFFSTRPDAAALGDRDLWVARRPTTGSDFGVPSLVPDVNSDALDHLPRLSPDELTLMFVSGRDGANAFSNIWISERPTRDAAFSVPIELAGINSDLREEGFTLSSDGLTLLFASNRIDEADMDIWVATRLSRVDDFGAVENLSEINLPTADDIDPALSADGFELFFASERNGPVQLFRSTRLCLGADAVP
jgi:Tol biopolymer transport system component